jgi:TM2 domain-containing membrane protein YozV
LYKNPGVAAVLSFFIPGLGQIYNGNFGKGLMHILIGVVGAFLIIEGSFPFAFIFVVLLLNAAISCFSAYHDAEDYNGKLESKDKGIAEGQEGYGYHYEKQSNPLIWLMLPFVVIVLVILLVISL